MQEIEKEWRDGKEERERSVRKMRKNGR